MRTASTRFKASLGKTTRWVNLIEWTNDGITWQSADLISGSVTRDLSSNIHWTASLELANVSVGLDAINAFNTRMKIHHGIWFGPNSVELLPFGVYRVTETAYNPDELSVSVSLESYESFMSQANFIKPASINTGSAQSVLGDLFAGVFGDAYSITWDDDMKAKADTIIPGTTGVEERWPVVDGDSNSVAAALGARIHTDENGGWRVRKVPTLKDAPVLDIARGELLISHEVTYSAEDVTNIVVASGTDVSGVSIGPAVVRDDNPLSATYADRPIANGGFGEAPIELTSSRVNTEGQCLEFAQSQLAQYLGLKETVTWSGVHYPLLEPGDVVTVDSNPVILDSVTYDLLGAELSANTRTQSADLLGSAWEIQTENEDDSGDN